MLLRVIAVKWQMPDDRVATFELRLQVRRPEEALHHRALVLTIRCEHDETATLQKLNERGPPWARVKSALYIRMRSGVDMSGTALCTLSWLYKTLRV